jgi:hypothetical protein
MELKNGIAAQRFILPFDFRVLVFWDTSCSCNAMQSSATDPTPWVVVMSEANLKLVYMSSYLKHFGPEAVGSEKLDRNA